MACNDARTLMPGDESNEGGGLLFCEMSQRGIKGRIGFPENIIQRALDEHIRLNSVAVVKSAVGLKGCHGGQHDLQTAFLQDRLSTSTAAAAARTAHQCDVRQSLEGTEKDIRRTETRLVHEDHDGFLVVRPLFLERHDHIMPRAEIF